MNRPLARTKPSPNAFLADLNPASLEPMLSAAQRRQYPAGAFLFHQGDAPSHLFQIRSGLVKVVQVSRGGAATTLHMLGPGDLVGCLAMVQQVPFPATAVACQECSISSWTASQLQALMAQYPAVAASLIRDMGARAQEMANRVADMLHKPVEQRIAGVLLRLGALAGRSCEAGVQIEAPITRNDIAELAGATYFTVSRTLGEWQKRGLVSIGRERIVILAPGRLAEIAGPPSFGGEGQ